MLRATRISASCFEAVPATLVASHRSTGRTHTCFTEKTNFITRTFHFPLYAPNRSFARGRIAGKVRSKRLSKKDTNVLKVKGSDAAPPPPHDPWQAVTDKDSGLVYWWNTETDETTELGAPKPTSIMSEQQVSLKN